MPLNPYAHSRNEDEFGEPAYSESQDGYAAALPSDNEGGAPYNNEFGWAPKLRVSPDGVPDASRLGFQPRRDLYQKPEYPSEDPRNLSQLRDQDQASRNAITHTTIMPREQKFRAGDMDPALGANRWARNPREIPPPEPRFTQQLIPVMRFFTRPFETGLPKMGARRLNGMHFSMADHRRDYDILGMMPQRTRRNTYRIEPTPWDTDLIDLPAPDDTPDVQPVPGLAVAAPSRSWRLGG